MSVSFFWPRLAALWIHFHLLGVWALWPPTFDDIIARSVLVLPLAPACALLLEYTNPHTFPIQYIVRRLRPGEVLSHTTMASPEPLTGQASLPHEPPHQ